MSDGGTVPVVVSAAEHRWYRHETWRYAGSSGDDVVADAWLAHQPGPVVIAGHGAESDRTAQYVRGAGKSWARGGLSVVAADAPHHGDRAGSGRHPGLDDLHRPEFVRRAAADLLCLVDAAVGRLGREGPIGYLGFSMGVQYGAPAVAADERVRAAVFVVGGSTAVAIPELFGEVTAEVREAVELVDPVRSAGAIAPRPVLMVNADRDEIFSRASALALYDALEPPKEITFFPGSHAVWTSPGRWYRRMEAFFREHL